ncbi:MAG: hypothetical protein A2017_20345 [Lentisphaerae bacterium GWF2_44_16]|nr:MAG: hypothetical protein A2017_20345 [Lentisphaerae bacterium GWF2_44_16]
MPRAVILLCLAGFSFSLFSQTTPETAQKQPERVTPSQIMRLAHNAARLVDEKGLDAALPILSDPNGPYMKGDTYVFVYTFDGSLIMNPRHKSDEGRRLINSKDEKGNPFIAYFVEIAKGPDHEGWSDEYWIPKPGGTKPFLKVSYIVGIPRMRIFVGAGIYGMTKLEAQNSID